MVVVFFDFSDDISFFINLMSIIWILIVLFSISQKFMHPPAVVETKIFSDVLGLHLRLDIWIKSKLISSKVVMKISF